MFPPLSSCATSWEPSWDRSSRFFLIIFSATCLCLIVMFFTPRNSIWFFQVYLVVLMISCPFSLLDTFDYSLNILNTLILCSMSNDSNVWGHWRPDFIISAYSHLHCFKSLCFVIWFILNLFFLLVMWGHGQPWVTGDRGREHWSKNSMNKLLPLMLLFLGLWTLKALRLGVCGISSP